MSFSYANWRLSNRLTDRMSVPTPPRLLSVVCTRVHNQWQVGFSFISSSQCWNKGHGRTNSRLHVRHIRIFEPAVYLHCRLRLDYSTSLFEFERRHFWAITYYMHKCRIWCVQLSNCDQPNSCTHLVSVRTCTCMYWTCTWLYRWKRCFLCVSVDAKPGYVFTLMYMYMSCFDVGWLPSVLCLHV